MWTPWNIYEPRIIWNPISMCESSDFEAHHKHTSHKKRENQLRNTSHQTLKPIVNIRASNALKPNDHVRANPWVKPNSDVRATRSVKPRSKLRAKMIWKPLLECEPMNICNPSWVASHPSFETHHHNASHQWIETIQRMRAYKRPHTCLKQL